MGTNETRTGSFPSTKSRFETRDFLLARLASFRQLDGSSMFPDGIPYSASARIEEAFADERRARERESRRIESSRRLLGFMKAAIPRRDK